jgi:hypothetical protein
MAGCPRITDEVAPLAALDAAASSNHTYPMSCLRHVNSTQRQPGRHSVLTQMPHVAAQPSGSKHLPTQGPAKGDCSLASNKGIRNHLPTVLQPCIRQPAAVHLVLPPNTRPSVPPTPCCLCSLSQTTSLTPYSRVPPQGPQPSQPTGSGSDAEPAALLLPPAAAGALPWPAVEGAGACGPAWPATAGCVALTPPPAAPAVAAAAGIAAGIAAAAGAAAAAAAGGGAAAGPAAVPNTVSLIRSGCEPMAFRKNCRPR